MDEELVAKYYAKQHEAYDHLCADGQLYTGIKRPKGFRKMTPKQCFSNSQRIALGHAALRLHERPAYVQGICIGEVGAFEHGWLTLDGIHAIDVTLPDAESSYYFGVAFDAASIRRQILKTGFYQQMMPDLSSVHLPPQLIAAMKKAA